MKAFFRLTRFLLLGCALLALCPGHGNAAQGAVAQNEERGDRLQPSTGTPAAAPGTAPGAETKSAAAPALPPLTPKAASPAPSASPAAEAPSTATPLPDINLSWAGYFQALGILCLALAALWAVLWFFKRRGGFGNTLFSGDPAMRVESRLALGPKKWILVVRCLDRRLVIGVSDQNMTLLSEIYDEPNEAQPGVKTPESGNADASGPHFASFLRKDKETSRKNSG